MADNIVKNVKCPDCKGRGHFKFIVGVLGCAKCRGTGKIHLRQLSADDELYVTAKEKIEAGEAVTIMGPNGHVIECSTLPELWSARATLAEETQETRP